METAPNHIQRAFDLLQLGRPALALREVQQALAHDPTSAEAHECGAWVLGALGRTAEAEAAARQALALNPQLGDAHLVVALLQASHNDPAARESFATAYSLPSGDPVFRADVYAQFLAAHDELPQALQIIEVALIHYPNAAQLHARRGFVLHQAAQLDEAEIAFHIALRASPITAEAHYGLGLILLERERFAEAQDAFREALRGQPTHEEARRGLARTFTASQPVYGRVLLWLLFDRQKLVQRMRMGVSWAFVVSLMLCVIALCLNMTLLMRR